MVDKETKLKKVICFYHGADLDGKCSGAIVKNVFPDAKLIPCDYGYKIDWSLINKDTVVIMTDFSFPKDDMIRLKKESKQFIWIDHHISKINELKDIEFDGLRVDGTAACILTWKYFNKQNIPYSVELLGRYDVWDLVDEDVLRFQYGIRQYDCNPINIEFWGFVFFDVMFVDNVLKDGKLLCNYIIADNKLRVNGLGFLTKFRSYTILAANISYVSSLFFEDHPEVNNVDILMPFSWNGKSWKISMYTKLDEVDVSKICYEFGGGGHKKAAGFTTKELPEEFQKIIFGE